MCINKEDMASLGLKIVKNHAANLQHFGISFLVYSEKSSYKLSTTIILYRNIS